MRGVSLAVVKTRLGVSMHELDQSTGRRLIEESHAHVDGVQRRCLGDEQIVAGLITIKRQTKGKGDQERQKAQNAGQDIARVIGVAHGRQPTRQPRRSFAQRQQDEKQPAGDDEQGGLIEKLVHVSPSVTVRRWRDTSRSLGRVKGRRGLLSVPVQPGAPSCPRRRQPTGPSEIDLPNAR